MTGESIMSVAFSERESQYDFAPRIGCYSLVTPIAGGSSRKLEHDKRPSVERYKPRRRGENAEREEPVAPAGGRFF